MEEAKVDAAALSNDSQSQPCRTSLIPDSPSDIDEFGPHKRIATAIADLIRGESGGIAIGVEGDWGSGKTTVIKLLQKLLQVEEKDSHQTLLLFNAWAHEGDPLRRTFLESLIQHLTNKGWVDETEWDEQLEIIGRKKEKKRTRTDPHLTRLGKAFGLSLLLIPLGVAFLGAALRHELKLSFSNFDIYLTLYFFLGLLLILGPLWLYFLVRGILFRIPSVKQWLTASQAQKPEQICQHSIKRDKQGKAITENYGGSTQIEHMLMNRVITEEQTVTTKTPDPTAIEFEETFAHLMRDALDAKGAPEADKPEEKMTEKESAEKAQRRIILVLDNLDRVAASDALSIWSTLQTFLKQRQDNDSEWFKRVWIIVPYDRSGLSVLWEKDGSGTGTTAVSFMDKSFQVRFEVPEPVRSEWRSFLDKQLEKAFPDHAKKKAELRTVYRVMAIYLARQNKIPTIRELKLYVNQIGSVHRQWCPAIPLAHMAYFVMLRRPSDKWVEGVDIVTALLSNQIASSNPNLPSPGNFPEEDILDLLDESVEDVRDNLAALSFNVEKETARQLLLKDPIINALGLAGVENLTTDIEARDRNLEVLRNYADFKGFWEVLEAIINEEWTKGEADKVARAAYCLKESGLLQKADAEVSQSVIRALRQMAYKVNSWPPLSPVKATGLTALLSLVNDKSYTTNLLTKTTKNLVEADNDDEKLQVKNWTTELKAVQQELVSLNQAEAFKKGVFEPLSADFRLTPVLSNTKYRVYLEALSEFSLTDPTAKSLLDELATKGEVFRRLNTASPRSDDAIAWGILTLLRHHPQSLLQVTSDSPLSKWIEGRMEFIIKEFIPLLVRYRELSPLFNLLTANNSLKLLASSSLEELPAFDFSSETDLTELHLDADILLDNWSLLENELRPGALEELLSKYPVNSERFINFIKFLVKRTDVIGEIEKTTFDENQIELYQKLYEHGEKPEGLRNFLIKELQSVTMKEWHTELVNDGRFLNLALHISRIDDDGRALLSGQEFRAALAEYAKEVAAGYTPPTPQNDLAAMLGKDTDERNSFRRHLSQLLIENVQHLSSDFFDLFASELSDLQFLAQGNKSILSVFSALLRARNVSGLQWMANINVYEWLRLDQRSQLTGFVRRALSEKKDDAAYPYLFRIADALKLHNLDEVDRTAAEYQVAIRPILEIPGIHGLKVLERMRDKLEFYSLASFIDIAINDSTSLQLDTIQLNLIQLQNSEIKDENKGRLTMRLLEVLNNVIREASEMPPGKKDNLP